MSRFKSLIVRASVMAMIVGLLPSATTIPASAQNPDDVVFSDLIVLTGATLSGMTTPIHKMYNLGNYRFKVKTCVAQSDPAEVEGGLVDLTPFDCVGNPPWESPGTYENLVCGTGTAHGFLPGPIGPEGEELLDAEYWIKFISGKGILTGNVTEREVGGVTYPASLYGKLRLEPLDLEEFQGHMADPDDEICTNLGFKVTVLVKVLQSINRP